MKNTVYFIHGRLKDPAMTVGLDLDLTSMDNDILWAKHFREVPCLAPTPHRQVAEGEISLTYDHFKLICPPCFEECIQNPEIVGAHKPLPFLAKAIEDLYAHGVRFHAVTTRPPSNYDATVEWLFRHKIAPYLASVTFTAEKRQVCDALGLDYMVDDSPFVFADLNDGTPCKTQVVLMNHAYNQNVPAKIRVNDWREGYRFLYGAMRERVRGAV